jgi:hypothetical protein
MENSKNYLPIYLLLGWLGFTLFFFLFGPWTYKLTNEFVFYSYLILVHLAIFLGYHKGLSNTSGVLRIKTDYYRLLELSILISVVYLVIKLVLTSGGNLSHFMRTFNNANDSYLNSSMRHPNMISYTDIFFFPILIFAITNAIYSNKNLRRPYRYCVYFLILVTIASSIGSATRGQIAQIVILSFAAFILGVYKKNIVFGPSQKALTIISVSCILIGFFVYSNYLINNRGKTDSGINPITLERSNPEYFVYKITPENLYPLINSTSFYVSHSYYQLSKALKLPSKGIGFGLTNSYFIMNNIEKITGNSNLKDISYGIRLDREIGGNYGQFWSTFYTWIASDVTFAGTILVVFFIGLLLSLSLRDSLFSLNPFAVTSFCTIFHFIFHFPFNNPMQDGAGLTTYFVIPIVWLFLRKPDSAVSVSTSIKSFWSLK